MNAIVSAYLGYLAVSVALTVWVGRTLFSSGRAFLERVFAGQGDVADSVNRLLLVGFYLVNVGFIALHMKTRATIDDAQTALELLVEKVGVVVLVLGAMHFLNLYVFSRIWRGRAVAAVAPVDDRGPAARAPSYPTRSSLLDAPQAGLAAVPAVDGAAIGARS